MTQTSPTIEPRPVLHRGMAHNLPQVVAYIEARRRDPILSLAQALLVLRAIDPATLRTIASEEPDLLRSRSQELVERVLVSEDDLHRALALVAGLVEVDARDMEIEPQVFERLPLRLARQHGVLPIGRALDQLVVASPMPTLASLHQQLTTVTGHSVLLVWASRKAIDERLSHLEARHRSAPASSGAAAAQEARLRLDPHGRSSAQPEDLALQDLVVQAMAEVAANSDAEQASDGSESAGMVRLVNQMIGDAQRMKASDIHIETNPGDTLTQVRFRRDGDLEPYMWLPAKLRAALVSRVKIMSRLDIAERRRPQDGKIDFSEFGGRALELRVAIMPTNNGLEDVVLRLLESARPLPLGRLGLQARDRERIAAFSGRTFGLVLAAGPTGSGKTTTLHSMLAEVNTAERKIWTAEDPIEITQPGLRQVQVNSKIGLTFASAMRSFLRADPDIIMIGEIRDAETAKIAIEASLTGHLVLSTLHTNNACESVVRLLDLGMDPMNFADSLVGIVAQRLVRALCPHCAVPQPMNEAAWAALLDEYCEGTSLPREEAQQRLLDAAGSDGAAPQTRMARVGGCEHCSGKGYKGRLGVYEILENQRPIKSLIQSRARPSDIFETAVKHGLRSLRHDALEKVVQGLVDLKQARTAYL